MADPLYAFDQASADALKQACQTLGGLSQQIVEAGKAINGPDLGPWHIQWDCCTQSAWIFGCWETTTCWQNVDFTTVRIPLQQLIGQAEAHSQTFLQALSPLHTWVSVVVPDTTTKFQALQSALEAVQAETPSSDDQRQQILAAFGALASALDAGQSELRNLETAVAQYIQEQDNWQTQIDGARAWMETSINDALTAMQQKAQQSPCPGDGSDQFIARKALFQQTVATFDETISRLAVQTRAADDALALIVGTVANFVNSYDVAIQELRAAEASAFSAALEQLHFDVSVRSWEQLAASAAHQLAPLSWQQDYLAAMLADVARAG